MGCNWALPISPLFLRLGVSFLGLVISRGSLLMDTEMSCVPFLNGWIEAFDGDARTEARRLAVESHAVGSAHKWRKERIWKGVGITVVIEWECAVLLHSFPVI